MVVGEGRGEKRSGWKHYWVLIDALCRGCIEEGERGDEFEYQLGLHPKLDHIPKVGPESNITHVYAVAHYKDGGYNFIVLTKSEVEALRLRSPMQKAIPSGAWKTDYEAMAKAKAIKQLSKYMPLSDEMVNAVRADEAVINQKALSNNRTGILLDELDYPEGETIDGEAEDVSEN